MTVQEELIDLRAMFEKAKVDRDALMRDAALRDQVNKLQTELIASLREQIQLLKNQLNAKWEKK